MGNTVDRARWRRRGATAAMLEAVALMAPGVFGVAVAVAVPTWARPVGLATSVAVWALGVAIGTGVAIGADRVLRRMLPLVVLLRLSLVFPDRAPSRFRVALRAGTLRNIDEKLARLAERGVDGDPVAAAEQILGLLSALTRYDRRTRGHSERVRAFADLIAAEMRIPAEERDRLRWSALLHDVGKLHVDVSILNKPGALDAREWHEVREHPHVGARIAAPLLPWLGSWGAAIEHHHERWNGSGYPHGIAGDEIALGARIVAVADAFEVMTAARSYKQPMGVAEAREELLRCAGEQFDPEVVRALFAVSITRLRWIVGPAAFVALIPGARRAWTATGEWAHRPAFRAGVAAVCAAVAIPATEGSTTNEIAPTGNGAVASAGSPEELPNGWAVVRGISIERDDRIAVATELDVATSPAPAEVIGRTAARIDDAAPVPTQPGAVSAGPPSDEPSATAQRPADRGPGATPGAAPPGQTISAAARSSSGRGHGVAVSSTAHATPKPSDGARP